MWGIHRSPVNSSHKGPVTRKNFHLMTSSCMQFLTRPSGQRCVSTFYHQSYLYCWLHHQWCVTISPHIYILYVPVIPRKEHNRQEASSKLRTGFLKRNHRNKWKYFRQSGWPSLTRFKIQENIVHMQICFQWGNTKNHNENRRQLLHHQRLFT